MLQPDKPTICINHMNNLFQKSKLAIIHEIENGITIFDKTKPTSMTTDLSMTFSIPDSVALKKNHDYTDSGCVY